MIWVKCSKHPFESIDRTDAIFIRKKLPEPIKPMFAESLCSRPILNPGDYSTNGKKEYFVKWVSEIAPISPSWIFQVDKFNVENRLCVALGLALPKSKINFVYSLIISNLQPVMAGVFLACPNKKNINHETSQRPIGLFVDYLIFFFLIKNIALNQRFYCEF